MNRVALILLTSLVVGSQSFLSADKANSSEMLDKEQDTNREVADGSVLMRETFGNNGDLKVFNDNGNWAIEKEEDGNLVYCNKVKDSWTEFNFGENHWSNYSISYRLKFESHNRGRVETHIRKRNRKDYRTGLNKHDGKVKVDLLGRNLVATVPANDWFNVQLSASGSEIETSINEGGSISVIDTKLQTGGGMIAVSANSKVCVDDIVVRQIGTSRKTANSNTNINKLKLMGHESILMGYDSIHRSVAEEIIRSLGDKNKDLEIFDGHLFQPPSNLGKRLSDASLEYYYRISEVSFRPRERYYIIKASNNHVEFETSFNSHKKIDEQMKHGTIFSFIFYSEDKIVYDVLPPQGRFTMSLNEESYFPSHSMGKSITSYLLGHAICSGYIGGVDDAIIDWPLMENTLYYGQPLIRLLNMSAGDTNVIKEQSGNFIKTGANIHTQPLIDAVENEDELKNTKPVKNASHSYSNLTSDILFNYIAHRVGDDFDSFLSKFYQQKIGIKHPVYLWLSPLRHNAKPSIETITTQGAWQYGISATRYDFLRIAIAILNDWKNDTCEGKYLKEIYQRAVPTGYNGNWGPRRDGGYPKFNNATSKYAGQFYTSVNGMYDKNIIVMDGADGQQIVINLDDERIVVISAGQANWYNTKSIAYDLIKSGKMKSGNWN